MQNIYIEDSNTYSTELLALWDVNTGEIIAVPFAAAYQKMLNATMVGQGTSTLSTVASPFNGQKELWLQDTLVQDLTGAASAVSKVSLSDLNILTSVSKFQVVGSDLVLEYSDEAGTVNTKTIPTSSLYTATIINDTLTSTSATEALSAKQGKILNDADIASGALIGTDFVLTKKDNTTITIDATAMLADVRVSSGVYNSTTKALDFTLSDSSVISVPVSALLPVTHDNTLSGNGSTTPLSVAISTTANNRLTTDANGLFVSNEFAEFVSGKGFVAITDEDGVMKVVSNMNDLDSATAMLDNDKLYFYSVIDDKNQGITLADFKNLVAVTPAVATIVDNIDGTVTTTLASQVQEAIRPISELTAQSAILTDEILFKNGTNHRKTSLNQIKTLLAVLDDVVDVTGVTFPITYPTTTLPGTPVFSPATPALTTAIYALTDGTFAKWNGTQYISAPAPTTGTPFVKSGTTVDAGTDKIANITRTGFIGVAGKTPTSSITGSSLAMNIANVSAPYSTTPNDHTVRISGGVTGGLTLHPSVNTRGQIMVLLNDNAVPLPLLGQQLVSHNSSPTVLTSIPANSGFTIQELNGNWIVIDTDIPAVVTATTNTLASNTASGIVSTVNGVPSTLTPAFGQDTSYLGFNAAGTLVKTGRVIEYNPITASTVQLLVDPNYLTTTVVPFSGAKATTDYILPLTGNFVGQIFTMRNQDGSPAVIQTTNSTMTSPLIIPAGNVTPQVAVWHWNGLAWVYTPNTTVANADSFRSGTGTTLPDGTTDTTENVSRVGKTGFGMVDPTALTSTVDIVGTFDTRPTQVSASVTTTTPGSFTTVPSFVIPNAIVDVNSNIELTGITVDTIITLGTVNSLNPTLNALYKGRYLRLHNADSNTARAIYKETEILPGKYLDLQHNGRFWDVETDYLENWEGFEFTGTPVSVLGFSSGTTTYVDVPSAFFVAPTPGDYWVKYTVYASNTSPIMPTVRGNDVRMMTDNVTGTFVEITGSVSEIGNSTGGVIDSYTKYFRVRTVRANQQVKLQMNSVGGNTTIYQSPTQLSTIEWKRYTTPVLASATALKKFRVVQNLVTGANLITDNLGLIAPFARNVEVRLDSTGELIACRVTLETNNTVTITTTAPVTGARITIIG
jgi:hypothetical protein